MRCSSSSRAPTRSPKRCTAPIPRKATPAKTRAERKRPAALQRVRRASELRLALHARPRLVHWVLEYMSPQFERFERLMSRRRRKQMANAPIKFRPGDWRAFFAARGWQPKEIRFLVAESERHRRPPPVPRWMMLVARLIFRNQRGAVRENYGFALMERRPSGAR